ncbi:MAG TPA: hypothetical protein VH012_00405 [Acidimicrobiales bacterium]|jgi:hypothetical protein|nr:hypothetical protein [Acidimicrobiales bacterium]
MRVRAIRGSWVVRGGSVVFVGGLMLALTGSAAWASSDCTSDHRAKPTHGNDPKTCRALGYGGDTWVGSNAGHGATDSELAGTVQTNDGTVQPGTGQEVDLAMKGFPGAVVDAVVVGGDAWYNTYKDHGSLPPGRGARQHYIPPLDGGQKVSWVSYWYACYHVDPQPALPEVPQALEVPLAGGAIFAAYLFVQHRRRKAASAP